MQKYPLAYNVGKGWQKRQFVGISARYNFMNRLIDKYGEQLEFAEKVPSVRTECQKCGLAKNKAACKLFKNGDCTVFLSEEE
jgi:thymidine kinase